MENTYKVAALAGGVGGAKLAHGLQAILPPGALSVVVNTADDFDLWGLRISPDIDTVMYTLSGLANRAQGWGLEADTWSGLEMMQRYGQDAWFRLGDMDTATHVLRTHMLRQGLTITEVTASLAAALNIPSAILPMCNESIQTLIETADGLLDFQDYFVRHRHSDTVTGIKFKTSAAPVTTAGVQATLAQASAIVFCPSNPIVSIGPILYVEGIRDALGKAHAPKVAVSPIVGGAALKGPAADMLRSLGHEVSPVGVAKIYNGIIDGLVIDTEDAQYAGQIGDMGIEVEVTNSIMKSDEDRAALAQTVLDLCGRLSASRGA